MGRPYPSELRRIPATIEWALCQDISALRYTLLRELGVHNLVAIGSGGSLTAAVFAALLHESATGRLARAATPVEAITRPPPRDTAALLLSARGTNTDIRRAAAMLPELGFDAMSAVTTRVDSPLSRILMGYRATTHEFSIPGGRDGFLATNSLIATMVLLYRAAMSVSLTSGTDGDQLGVLRPAIVGSEKVLNNRTLVVLAQGWASPAAVDFESRFSEAALANVTVTDLRNFAHGRHNWLSLHAADTGIVSLETQGTTREATRMLRFLPNDIDVLRVQSRQEGPTATIELVCAVMEFAGQVAHIRGLDPGRPSVANFGRRLYRARANPFVENRQPTPIAKKRRALFLSPRSNGEKLTTALQDFVQRLERTSFIGIVVDYDGTLSARHPNSKHLESDIQEELNRLLAEGILLGIASGRGDSIFRQLQIALHPKYWHRVVVGLYNGAQVVELSEDIREESDDEIPPPLLTAHARMSRLETVLGFKATLRRHQVSLRNLNGPDPSELRTVAIEQLADINDVLVVTSSHSVDIVLKGTTKTSVVDALFSRRPGCILRIGDQGAIGGNDFDLLNSGLSLSVDRVSSNLATCWNLGSPGLSGPPLTLRYLRALHVGRDGFRLNTSLILVDK